MQKSYEDKLTSACDVADNEVLKTHHVVMIKVVMIKVVMTEPVVGEAVKRKVLIHTKTHIRDMNSLEYYLCHMIIIFYSSLDAEEIFKKCLKKRYRFYLFKIHTLLFFIHVDT